MALREIVLELGVELDQADMDKATDAIEKLKTAAITVGTVFATGALAVGFNKLIDFASAAAERTNKFRAVFIEASGDVQEQLRDISARTGIATGQLEGFAAGIGAIVKPALGSSAAAGELSANIAELALDIASFNDVEPTDALIALRAGLIGSAEPLFKFGVDLRIASLQAEALRQGITKSVKSMSEGERVQLRFAKIMRDLGAAGALGDATRTADDLANATRGLSSQFQFFLEIIGDFFLEDAKKTTVRLRQIVQGINAWLLANDAIIRQRIDKVLQVINNTIKAIVGGVKFLISGFQALSTVIGPVATAILVAVAAIVALVAILGAPIVFVLALGAAIGLIIDDLVVFAEGGNSLFGLLLDGIRDFLAEFPAAQAAFDGMIDGLKDLFSVFFDDTEDTATGFIGKLVNILTGLWEKGTLLWDDVIEGFLTNTATTIISGLKRIFGGTFGRIIIDFLGAKAGSVVGEFMGRLVGTLVGKLIGKGRLGKALAVRLNTELFGFLGKGAGAIVGGLTADDFALGLQNIINAPEGTVSAGAAAGSRTLIDQSRTEFNMEIDASGKEDPAAIGTVVANEVDKTLANERRQTMGAFNVAMETP